MYLKQIDTMWRNINILNWTLFDGMVNKNQFVCVCVTAYTYIEN